MAGTTVKVERAEDPAVKYDEDFRGVEKKLYAEMDAKIQGVLEQIQELKKALEDLCGG